jgi:hypothetical protein
VCNAHTHTLNATSGYQTASGVSFGLLYKVSMHRWIADSEPDTVSPALLGRFKLFHPIGRGKVNCPILGMLMVRSIGLLKNIRLCLCVRLKEIGVSDKVTG